MRPLYFELEQVSVRAELRDSGMVRLQAWDAGEYLGALTGRLELLAAQVDAFVTGKLSWGAVPGLAWEVMAQALAVFQQDGRDQPLPPPVASHGPSCSQPIRTLCLAHGQRTYGGHVRCRCCGSVYEVRQGRLWACYDTETRDYAELTHDAACVCGERLFLVPGADYSHEAWLLQQRLGGLIPMGLVTKRGAPNEFGAAQAVCVCCAPALMQPGPDSIQATRVSFPASLGLNARRSYHDLCREDWRSAVCLDPECNAAVRDVQVHLWPGRELRWAGRCKQHGKEHREQRALIDSAVERMSKGEVAHA